MRVHTQTLSPLPLPLSQFSRIFLSSRARARARALSLSLTETYTHKSSLCGTAGLGAHIMRVHTNAVDLPSRPVLSPGCVRRLVACAALFPVILPCPYSCSTARHPCRSPRCTPPVSYCTLPVCLCVCLVLPAACVCEEVQEDGLAVRVEG